MAILQIRTKGDPILKQKAKKVLDVLDTKVQLLISDMIDTLQDRGGVGLAANQVGSDLAILLHDESGDGNPEVLINPEIKETGFRKYISIEGCLSLPKIVLPVRRFYDIIVTGLDRNGEEVTIETKTPLLAAILQHEMDHLNGILLTDKLSSLQKKIFKKRLKKGKKE